MTEHEDQEDVQVRKIELPCLRERERNFEQEVPGNEGGGEWWLANNGDFVVTNQTLRAASYLFDMFDSLTDVDGQVVFSLGDLVCGFRAAINNSIDKKTDVIDEQDRRVLVTWLAAWGAEIERLWSELADAPEVEK